MKFEGKVTVMDVFQDTIGRWGTCKEVALTLSNTAASTTFSNVTKSDLDNLIKDLKRIKKKLKEAPDKNAFG